VTNPFADPGPATATAPPAAPAPAPPPAAQPTAPAPTVDQFGGADPFANSDPAKPAAKGPRLRELYGRLLILIPAKVEVVPNRLGKPGETQDRMTADVVVLDGGTIHYGGKPEEVPSVPHDKTAEVPHKFPSMFISSVALISQCRDALASRQQGKPGMVIGRLTKGEDTGKGNPPWILTPATDADKAIGRAWLASNDPFTSAR
jgi:hypothetical protein